MPSALPPPPEFGEALPIVPVPEVLRFLARRRSAPAVTLAAPGPDPQQLSELLRLAARAPDHGKLAPWRFVVMGTEAKAAFAQQLDELAARRAEPALGAKLSKLKAPPLAVFVIASPKPGAIPEWEQLLSAGAVCANLLTAALAMGFGANWITDWYSYDEDSTALLGLRANERVAACMLIGTPSEAPLERDRPLQEPLVTYWSPPGAEG